MRRRFTLLGLLNIEAGGQPSPVMSSHKGCALLAYLIIKQQPQSREVVADLLWQSISTSQSLARLRTLLSRIQKWVPELVVTRQSLTFQQNADTTLDLYSLHKALASKAINQIDEGLTLYQGPLLSDFYLEDAPRFDEWLLLERERLRHQVLNACHQTCTAYAKQEEWVKGIAAAQRWLALDELDETALQYLLQFLAASGQIELALQQYEISRQWLRAELEVEPAPETAQLAQRLQALKEKQGGGLSWTAIIGAQLERPFPHQLAESGELPANAFVPYQRNHDFTGRKQPLLHLANLLLPSDAAREQRALALTGMGGLGKTQTAVEFCYRYGRFFPGGVYWLSFADGNNVPEAVAAIGGERGMALYNEADNLKQADKVGRVTKAWQEPISRLLIFDNCEEDDLLAEWLPVTGGCAVLLTSRRSNWVRELQVAEWPLSVLEADESTRLLQNLVPNLIAADASHVAAELGHLPLALHLAGSFLRRYQQITAVQYLKQLQDKALLSHPSLQGRGTKHSPTGHELDIARTFVVNWERLEANNETDALALELLAYAAQFAPGEPIPRDILLSMGVKDETDVMQLLLAEDGLTRLVSLGFVKAVGEATLTVHRLVVAFVCAMLPNVAALETAVANTIWQRIKAQWDSISMLDQLPVIPTHVRYVMEKEQAKETPQGIHLTHAWGRHLMDLGDFMAARSSLEKALQMSEQAFNGAIQPETADILMTLGTLIWKTSSAELAWPHYQRAFTIYEQQFGDYHLKTARSLNNLAILHARTGDYDTAIVHYQRVLTIYEQILPSDNHQEVARTLFNLGLVYKRLENFALALSHYEISLRMRERIWPSDHPDIIATLGAIGAMYFRRGAYQMAYVYHQRALSEREKRLGLDHPETVGSVSNLGVTLGFLGEYERALHYLQRSLEIREKLYGSEHWQLAYTLTYLGYMWWAKGEIDKGRSYLERALSIQNTNGLDNEQTAETLTYLADLLIQVGESDQAYAHLTRALTIWEQGLPGTQIKTATTLICLGEWYEAQANNVVAISYYEQALALLTERVVGTHHELKRVQRHLQRTREEGGSLSAQG